MHGVIIEKGPQNWQILQQRNGYATVVLSGKVCVEETVLLDATSRVVISVVDENTNTRIIEPYFVALHKEHWCAEIRIPVGGPYTIQTYLRFKTNGRIRGDRIFHIGVGDVYLIAGQSNAVGVGKDCVNDPISSDVHMFRLNGIWDIATHPLHDTTDTCFPLSQEKVQNGHSPWINFGKILAKNLGYPIGLIPGTKGGIPLSYWDRTEDGKFFKNAYEIVKASGSEIKGILWSHGCNDASSEKMAKTYYERFKRVCNDFCKMYGEDIPILTVQLNKVVCTKTKQTLEVGFNYSLVREAQRRAMHEIPNVYMVPSIDLMVCDGIHNSAMSNMVIGERVANIALKYVYEKEVVCDAPDIREIRLESAKSLRLYFDHVYEKVFADENEVDKLMFSVVDKYGRIEPCDYWCPGDDSIVVSFEREIGKDALVNCDKYNDTGLIPYDLYTHLPIIPFSEVKVQI